MTCEPKGSAGSVMPEPRDGDIYLQFLESRRSRRQFGPGSVPPEEVDRIVQVLEAQA